jgi:hypothetical protein
VFAKARRLISFWTSWIHSMPVHKIHFNVILSLSLDEWALTEEDRNAYSVLVGETWLGRGRNRWENITKMDLTEFMSRMLGHSSGWECRPLATLVNVVKRIWIHKILGHFLTG